MIAHSILTAADYHDMPWKNGLGSTLELAIDPPRRGEGLGDFRWRVSIAKVADDGPFSRFPAMDRVILVLEGTGMILSHDEGGGARLEPLEPYTFSGDLTTTGALIDGPVRDFNVMTRRGEVSSRVAVIRPGATPENRTISGSTALLYLVQGRCRVVMPETGGEVEVSSGQTLRLDGAGRGTPVRISGEAGTVGILVELEAVHGEAG